MSNFPFPWWDKTVTIYNKYVDPTTQRVSWYRTVVENCFWKNVSTVYNMGRYGLSTVGIRIQTNDIVCRIPESSNYLDRREWKNSDDRGNFFTLNGGDIIVLGDVDDVIDEYTAGKRSTDLLTKYKAFNECLEIDGYVDNVQTGVELKHYRVIGK